MAEPQPPEEIIDLTGSGSTPAPNDRDRSDDELGTGASTPKRKERKKPRKKKKRKVTDVEEGEMIETPASESTGENGNGEVLNGGEDMFFVDLSAGAVPREVVSTDPAPESASVAEGKVDVHEKTVDEKEERLLLPAHVSVLAKEAEAVPIYDIDPNLGADVESREESEDYIDYLDYEDRRAPGMVRYFEEPEEPKQTKVVCKNCGAEGEHKTKECPVMICLTCGARDEHSTRSCPISKTCFSCGMKGHINKTCPNRNSSRRYDALDGCDRCGSEVHRTDECPTLWRIYEYVTDQERETILRTREEKRGLGIGNGAEGYIASDEWCYNCGDSGHLGDDCDVYQHPHDFPREPSAFSAYNTSSGPFYDMSDKASRDRARRRPREWEEGGLPDMPTNVGKRGRNKDRARMEEWARERDHEEDDPDNWFANPRNARNRGALPVGRGAPAGRRGGEDLLPPPRKLAFGDSLKDSRRFDEPRPGGSSRDLRPSPPPRPSLLDRLSDRRNDRQPTHDYARDDHYARDSYYDLPPSRGRVGDRRAGGSSRDMDRGSGYRREQEQRGPRYRGGYA